MVEKPDGTKVQTMPDGTTLTLYPDGIKVHFTIHVTKMCCGVHRSKGQEDSRGVWLLVTLWLILTLWLIVTCMDRCK